MSIHYIIDGYNVLYSIPHWQNFSREQRRIVFLKALDHQLQQQSRRNRMTVVLDGYASGLKGIKLPHIRLIQSEDQDADTVIKELVAHLPNPREAVVVTDDRAIRAAIKSYGAQVLRCKDFFRTNKKEPSTHYENKVDDRLAQAINIEFLKKWNLD